jgi:hypothetical protein
MVDGKRQWWMVDGNGRWRTVDGGWLMANRARGKRITGHHDVVTWAARIATCSGWARN